MQCFRRLRGSCQSFDGFDIQEIKGGGICKCRNLDSICFSRKAVVFCLVKLSAVTASQDERRGQCSTWTTDPRNALMINSVLMKMDAYSSFIYISVLASENASHVVGVNTNVAILELLRDG